MPGPRPKYILTKEAAALIRARYDGKVHGRCQEIADKLGWPIYAVRQWGHALGLSYKKKPNWTREDLEYVNDHYGLKSDEELARQLGRTPNGVTLAAKRHLHMLARKANFYTASDIAKLFGTPCAKKVVWWVEKGWLKGKPSPVSVGKSKMWLFTEKDIVRFLKRLPWMVNLRKMEDHFFRSVVDKERQRDPWYGAQEVAPMLGVKTIDAVHRYLTWGWLKGVKKPGGPYQGVWVVRRSAIRAFLKSDPRPAQRRERLVASKRVMRLKKGQPARLATLWVIPCPGCGMQVVAEASPMLTGPKVADLFRERVSGGCQHGVHVKLQKGGPTVEQGGTEADCAAGVPAL